MLGRFFKPKWQHAKAEKRIKAISKLRVDNAEDQTILSQLALSDQDALVRLNATEKLVNLDLLIKISKKDTVKSNQEQALHRISQILLSKAESPNETEKLAALSSLSDSNFLTHIALNSHDEAIRAQAVSQLIDDNSLAIIAEKSQRASIRVQATEKITAVELLENLCKNARNKDKGVFKTAKDKLQQIREQEKLDHERDQQTNKLIQAMEHLSCSDFFPLYNAKYQSIIQDWKVFDANASAEQKQAFTEFSAKALSTISAQEELEKQAAKKEAEKKRQQEQAYTLYSEICVLKESTSSLVTSNTDLENLQATLTQIGNAWSQVNERSSSEERAKFDKVTAQISNLISAYRIFFESEQSIVNLTNLLQDSGSLDKLRNHAKEARKLLSRLSWPKLQPKPEVIAQLECALDNAHNQLDKQNVHTQQLQNELSALLDELKLAIQNGEIRTADKQIKQAEQLSKRLNGSLTADLEQRIKALGGELQEIRDWQSYAVTPKKESLCTEMESLSSCDLPVQERANQIKRIQKEWKLLDATDSVHSQQLWKRFKRASDAAYAPCDEYFAEQRAIRLTNLKERERICIELEQLSAPQGTDLSEWKAYESSIRNAKQAWRSFSPVDRAPGKKLQSRFDALLGQQEEPLKALRQKNAALKSDLIDRASSILNADDLTGATDAIKALQQEWKLIGQAPRNQERKLWNQFRETCSEVFERYYNNPQSSRSSDSDSSKLRTLCDDLEQMIQSAYSLKLLESKLNQAKAICTNDDVSERARIDGIANFVTEQKKKLQHFESGLDTQFREKADLCEQLENAILEQGSKEELSSIKEQWPVSSDSSSLDKRFSTLIDIAEQPEKMDTMLSEQELRLRQLCIRLEIASSQPSPDEDQALRMEYQMERLQQVLEEQDQGFNFVEVKQIELEWLGIPFAGHFEDLSDRFEQQLQNLL